jgi:hypothetical protein
MTTKIQLLHSEVAGNVPEGGLLVGEIAFNVADGFQFVGYGGDVNYDVYGNPLEELPPPGMGWKTYTVGGGDQPGPPGPGVPPGGDTGQVLTKLTDGDYVTGWVDTFGPATPTTLGVVFGLTSANIGGSSSVAIGYQAHGNIGTGVQNVAIGYEAGLNQNNVSDNVVVGYHAGWNIDGDNNTIVGSEALGNDPGGAAAGNTAVGYQAGYNLTEGDGNTLIGYQAGIGLRAGGGNTILGNTPGSADLVQNVIIADGYGDIKFWANQAGAWSTDGIDFGTEDFVLTSQGPNLPPIWKEIPLGFVSRIVAGDNITIDPTSGTGVVTINAIGGGGGGGITSLRANEGLKVSGGGANPIVTSGGLEVDYTKVLGTYLYGTPGNIIYGGANAATPSVLPIGSIGQVLVVGPGNTLDWDTIEGASPATPTIFGTVYGSTSTAGSYYGYNAGVGVTGTNNTLIGENSGTQVNAGTNNTFIGSYTGFPGVSESVALSTGSGKVRFFANASGAWSINGDAQYGQPGQVLASQGTSFPPQWVTPVNAPIQDVLDGAGISTDITGTTLTISNTGVLSVTANAPIQAVDAGGNVILSAPNVLSDVQAGTGITIAGTGNSRTITNSGVVTLQNGTNTVATQVSPGVWKIDASGGGGGSITSLVEGAGINITNPTGPNSTITNAGVISIQDGANIVPDTNTGTVTLSLQNVVFDVTAAAGITIGGTAEHPTIANSGVISLQNGTGTTVQNVGNGVWQVNATGTAGVTKIIAGENVSITPISGTGEVTINAAGGGGGGNIEEIKAGTGITVNSGTGPITTITNNGVLSLTAGTNVTISGNTNNPVINAVGSLNNLTAGKGISITNPTGPNATIVNSGVVGLVAGANMTIQETSAGSGVYSLSASGGGGGGAVASVTGQGAGISVSPTTGAVVVQNTGVTSLAGTDGNITVSGSAGAVTVNIGSNVLTNVTAGNSGITVAGTGNTRSISATVAGLTAGAGIDLTNASGNFTIKNTGVLGLTAGANVTITETTPGSGNFTIASTGGGGGGSGTVTSITAGFGLTGGQITTSGTIAVDRDVVVNNESFGNLGSLIYGAGDPGWHILDAPLTDIGLGYYFLGITNLQGVPTWKVQYITDLVSTNSVKISRVNAAVNPGQFQADVDVSWLQSNAIPFTTTLDPFGTSGCLVTSERPILGATVAQKIVEPTQAGHILMLKTQSAANPLMPQWVDPAAELPGVTSVTATAPITVNNTTPNAPVIGFDVATTALTAYVPKSAYSATGALLVGSGVGTYSTLAPGSNGQILSVTASGALAWINAPTPGSSVSITAADDTVVVSPSPITGTGTIKVNSSKFVTAGTISTPGDLIVGAGSPALPSTLQASTTVGAVLTVTASSGNTRLGWSTTINGGTY